MFWGFYWKRTQPHLVAINLLPTLVVHHSCDECGHMPGFELRWAVWSGALMFCCFFGEADPRFLMDLGLLPEIPHDVRTDESIEDSREAREPGRPDLEDLGSGGNDPAGGAPDREDTGT